MAETKDNEFGEIDKIRYKVFSMRLHDETVELIKLRQKQSGKSWNLFIYKMLINNEIKK